MEATGTTGAAGAPEAAQQKETTNKPRGAFLYIEYAYLLRFPILAAALLAVGLPSGYYFAPAVFKGLFDAGGFWSFTFVIWLEFQLAWTIMVTSRLIVLYGPDRFGSGTYELQTLKPKQLILFGLLAIHPIVITWLGSLDPNLTPVLKGVGTLGGLVISVSVLALAAMLHFRIEHGGGKTAQIVLPSFGFLRPRFSRDEDWEADRNQFWKWVDRKATQLPKELTAGLVRFSKDGKKAWVRSGFELAFSVYVVLLIAYGVIGVVYSPSLVSSAERRPAALFFAIFLIMLWTWVFSGASFVFDRIRLPVLTTLLALSIATGFFHTDHQFRITSAPERPAIAPGDVVKAWKTGTRGGLDKPITVVATAGGGIQAAAWTTRVLTGLQGQCANKDFASSVLAISSVSGGSVGSMYFLAGYNADGSYPHERQLLEKVNYNASRSSLSSVGWGLLYPDLLRTIPIFGLAAPQNFDRGWSLENAWVAGWKAPPTINDWRSDVLKGLRPAAIFNATAGESGQRFLVGSTDLNAPGGIQFSRDFSGWDVPVATAARLSATFPYVSPMARASNGTPANRVHVGDGGYYDNSGIVGALSWLNDASSELSGRTVLFITIDAESGKAPDGQLWSWQRQISAPVETMLHVRSSSQRYRSQLEMDLMIESLQRKGVNIVAVPFVYTGDAPLSWHLNRDQKQAIVEAWTIHATKATLQSKDVVFQKLGCTANQ